MRRRCSPASAPAPPRKRSRPPSVRWGSPFPTTCGRATASTTGRGRRRGSPSPRISSTAWSGATCATCWRVGVASMGLVTDGTFADRGGIPTGPIRSDSVAPGLAAAHGRQRRQRPFPRPGSRTGGHVGQIIYWQYDDPGRQHRGANFREWFARFADELEAGDYDTEEGDQRPHSHRRSVLGLKDEDALRPPARLARRQRPRGAGRPAAPAQREEQIRAAERAMKSRFPPTSAPPISSTTASTPTTTAPSAPSSTAANGCA